AEATNSREPLREPAASPTIRAEATADATGAGSYLAAIAPGVSNFAAPRSKPVAVAAPGGQIRKAPLVDGNQWRGRYLVRCRCRRSRPSCVPLRRSAAAARFRPPDTFDPPPSRLRAPQ